MGIDIHSIGNYTTTRQELNNYLDTTGFAPGYTELARTIASLDHYPDDPYAWTHAAYSAVRDPDGHVFCAVTLAYRYTMEVYYTDGSQGTTDALATKALADYTGCEYEGVSAKILNLLTPTDNAISNEWRAKALKDWKLRRALRRITQGGPRNGVVVRLAQPINYAKLGEVDTVRILPSGNWATEDLQHRLKKPVRSRYLLNLDDLLAA